MEKFEGSVAKLLGNGWLSWGGMGGKVVGDGRLSCWRLLGMEG